MTTAAPSQLANNWALRPLRASERSLSFNLLAVLIGTVILALSSHIQVPMFPVPMTMQTFAVTLIGALYGWRLGGITVAAWLMEGALGLPVLAGGAAGVAHFFGKTGGYLFAFPLAAMLVGWLAERGWTGHRYIAAFAAMTLGNALCLLLGAAWLAKLTSLQVAIEFGVLPFVLGGLLKSVLGAATLKAAALSSRTDS